MKILQRLVFTLVVVFATSAINCMDIEQIRPNKELLDKLVKFHEPTESSYGSPKPTIAPYQKSGRQFIAKYDLDGFARYFTFKTDAGINSLVKGVQNGSATDVHWFYHDGPIMTLKQIAPSVIVIRESK